MLDRWEASEGGLLASRGGAGDEEGVCASAWGARVVKGMCEGDCDEAVVGSVGLAGFVDCASCVAVGVSLCSALSGLLEATGSPVPEITDTCWGLVLPFVESGFVVASFIFASAIFASSISPSSTSNFPGP